MCEYCKKESYNSEAAPLMDESAKLESGEVIADLRLDLVNGKDQYLDALVCIFDTPIIGKKLKINFCPMCGRKLRDMPDGTGI